MTFDDSVALWFQNSFPDVFSVSAEYSLRTCDFLRDDAHLLRDLLAVTLPVSQFLVLFQPSRVSLLI